MLFERRSPQRNYALLNGMNKRDSVLLQSVFISGKNGERTNSGVSRGGALGARAPP